jgi:hypothetical protein
MVFELLHELKKINKKLNKIEKRYEVNLKAKIRNARLMKMYASCHKKGQRIKENLRLCGIHA